MTEIVEQLRFLGLTEAADEIERLSAENDRLRALIAAWADADDALIALNGKGATYETLFDAERRSDDALDALRKAVGR